MIEIYKAPNGRELQYVASEVRFTVIRALSGVGLVTGWGPGYVFSDKVKLGAPPVLEGAPGGPHHPGLPNIWDQASALHAGEGERKILIHRALAGCLLRGLVPPRVHLLVIDVTGDLWRLYEKGAPWVVLK